ncbi:MAG: nodulation protein NfeD [Chloroflexi bacterium]|nr:nodulation protein NfeD [Chloroflexota bacterium]
MKKPWFVISILLFWISFTLLPIGGQRAVSAQSEAPVVVRMTFEGPLTPVWSTYLKRGIDQAISKNAQILILELNTPGGSIDLMNSLVQQILASPVGVAVYVSPRGAMAASAGTMLVLSGQIAAMTPESAIGAASPVGSQGENIETTLEKKTKEILKASVRSLALHRGAAAMQLAEQAIDTARAASAQEALQVGLIDYVAADIPDLLEKIDGRTIMVNGDQKTLDLQNAQILVVPTTFVENLLGLLTNPNIVFLILSIGVQALLIELSTPGGWVAGFFGVILLSLAVYGMGILPVNWFGAVFLVIAFVLFILDIKAPTHGALTIAGTGAFIAGALVLFNSVQVPGFGRVSVPLVVGMGIFLGLSFFAIVMIAVRAMKIPIATGKEALAGRAGTAITGINPAGIVQVAGERWSAKLKEGETPILEGERLIVDQVDGVKLIVRHF